MRYLSTRGDAPALGFEEAVLAGLASDGGLYVPEHIPVFAPHTLTGMRSLGYEALAFRVMTPFLGTAIGQEDLKNLLGDTYRGFRHSAIAPLEQLAPHEFLLELFHGPTLAFKDFALQFLGRVLEYFLDRRRQKVTVIGATSGDTGSAAIDGCRGRRNMRIFILHPHGRVSDVQRRQMTTIADDNVFNLAVDGTFDDCQDIVKALFANEEFRARQHLTAVNSINWARILAQIVYYFYAGLALGAPGRAVDFCVPTGNFGDIYAGYIAQKMGLPVGRLIIATNRNDILARCLRTGIYAMDGVSPTLSPSMDIQISSNFERLLFDLHNGDGGAIKTMMRDFRAQGKLTLAPGPLMKLRAQFAAGSADDAMTLKTIADVYAATGELLDPHTAVGVSVARQFADPSRPMVTLATAHPAKFPDAVKQATGVHPHLPPHLGALMKLPEKAHEIANDVNAVKRFIEDNG